MEDALAYAESRPIEILELWKFSLTEVMPAVIRTERIELVSNRPP